MNAVRGRLFLRGGGAIINIELPVMPDLLAFDGVEWSRKREFHVTLVGKEILRGLGLLASSRAELAIRGAAAGLRFEVILLDDFRIVREGDAATIVRMCRIPAADAFFDRFEAEMECRVVRPPYHVTLYTAGTSKGIALYSIDDLERAGRKLTADEADALMRAIT